MKLLVRPLPYIDESLESYLLRLCQENFYGQLGALLASIVHTYPKLNRIFEGAIPSDLRSINVCFANQSSDRRYRAIIELSNLANVSLSSIQNLIVFRSQQLFSSKHQAVIHQGVLVPRLFIRESNIPVCIDCFRSKKYVRKIWHYLPYDICHIHKKALTYRCPQCGSFLDYRKSFSVSLCECGFDLLESQESKVVSNEFLVMSTMVAGGEGELPTIFRDKTISQRFGALLWWHLEKNSEDIDNIFNGFIDYFNDWPLSLTNDLNQRLKYAELCAVTVPEQRKFSDAFGSLLKNSFRLPSSNFDGNFILREVVHWIYVALNSSDKLNISLLKLNLIEASILLNTTTKQVVRLIDFGSLKTIVRLGLGESIPLYSPILRLGDVFEQWVCGFQTEHSNLNQFLSKW